jgi:hypothetical protein
MRTWSDKNPQFYSRMQKKVDKNNFLSLFFLKMLLHKCGFSNTENFFSLFCIRLGNQEYSRSQLPTKIEKLEDWAKQPKTSCLLFFAFDCTYSYVECFHSEKFAIGGWRLTRPIFLKHSNPRHCKKTKLQ